MGYNTNLTDEQWTYWLKNREHPFEAGAFF